MRQWRQVAVFFLSIGVQTALAQVAAEPGGPSPAAAQASDAQAAAEKAAAEEKTAAVGEKTSFAGDNWMDWKKMTGDWGGLRNQMADAGITFDINVTQILQGNAHGGVDTKNGHRYSGSGDLTLTLDTAKMGLWDGGTFVLNAEPKWGDGILNKVGSLMPVNMDAVKPGFGEGCMMTLSEFFYQQVLFDGKLILLAGKLDGSRAFDTNVFANDERIQFMNLALRNNPVIPLFLPYTTMGVGAVVNPIEALSIRTAVTDAEGRAKTTGFETTFHGPTHTSLLHEWDIKVKPCGLPGNQRFGFLWTSMEKQHLQPKSPFKELGPTLTKVVGPKVMGWMAPYLPFDTSPDEVGLFYNFDQYLYTETNDPTQGVGLFGRFGWARQDASAIAHHYSFGVGGKGVVPTRDNDTFGVGYYYLDLSNKMPDAYNCEQGVEVYYNIAITPWLHISPDLQVIMDPGGSEAHDVSVVYGVRMQVNL
ncbi:MAG TPA: carbohydrate porin [Phycisphaerae bacterium]|nr:carbohydrate porin [Phycisphaerae bacterium]HRY66987.1 carbohydrate porin [Phycisphaerae bacterium]HSA28826.1 carbohydrate porin [Phycisphaerae bacterium]